MAETFHPFPKLPAELRLKVWEQAMMEERPDRRIILYQERVVPFKKLISPLLLVNFESRTCAQAFYNVKLDIYAVPPLGEDEFDVLDRKKQWYLIPGIESANNDKIENYDDGWLRSYFELFRNGLSGFGDLRPPSQHDLEIYEGGGGHVVDLKAHWSDYVKEKLREFGSYSAAEAETSRPPRGVFYISPEHDIFIDGYECGVHFYIDRATELIGTDVYGVEGIACHHISAKLAPATCKRVSTLVLVKTSPAIAGWHCVFAREYEICLYNHPLAYWKWHPDKWRQKTFPCVGVHFTLTSLDLSYGETDFLKVLTGAGDDDLSSGLDQWVTKSSYTNRRGDVMRTFKKKKVLNYRLRNCSAIAVSLLRSTVMSPVVQRLNPHSPKL